MQPEMKPMALQQTIHLDVHLRGWPWHLTAAWAGVLGYALSGAQEWGWRVVYLVLLVDALWGAWWRLFQPPDPEGTVVPRPLPYAEEGAPWYRLTRWVKAHFFSGLFLVTLGVVVVTQVLSPLALWASGVALFMALLGGWTSRVWPSLTPYISHVYCLALPLWAGAYINGHWTTAGGLAFALTAAAWAHLTSGALSWMWRAAALAGWGWTLYARVSPWFVSATLIAILLATFTKDKGRASTLWWLALSSTAVYFLMHNILGRL